MRKSLIATLLILSVGLFLLNAPLVKASGAKTWGTPLSVSQYIVIGNSDEVPIGNWAYVFQRQILSDKYLFKSDWDKMMNGDLTTLANEIESHILGSKCTWLRVSWEKAEETIPMPPDYQKWVLVSGFMVEAVVKNNGAGLTGAEIVLIIVAIAILVTIIALVLTGSWVTWQVINATQEIGPWMTITIGIAILAGIGFLLYSLLGGKVKYTSNKRGRRVELGK